MAEEFLNYLVTDYVFAMQQLVATILLRRRILLVVMEILRRIKCVQDMDESC